MAFTVLFVCTGNTCRSPMAVGILECLLPDQLKGRLRIESAGISVGTGQGASDGAVRVSSTRGIDLSGHVSRRLTRELIQKADLVVVMQQIHLKEVRRLCPERMEHVLLITELGKKGEMGSDGIPDPFGGPEEVYNDCFAQIGENLEAGMEFMIELVKAKEGSS
ncbi:MAG: hypothetical protein AMJ46_09125 [Latescibacteria bacterium DG_63]|nr:MAG: hypothetical protein AMJ46_09125 [Latescibacteria bacterium DG_63]